MTNQRPQLSLVGAVAIGLASMLGAGVFAVFSGAAALAGNLLLMATIIAGLVAALNALSVVQLARQIERPGGVYSYSRANLNDTTSFIAGFSFVLGKIGSIAAIALTFATYAAPDNTPWVASIAIALALVLAIYVLLVFGLQNALGSKLAESDAVFIDLIETSAPWLSPSTVVLVASAAALGSLLSLLAGVSRTAATMATDGELPRFISVRNRHGAPWLAELMIAFAAIALAQLEDLIWVIGFSSFSVLIYYGIGHLSAIRQPQTERLTPRWLNWLGLIFCLGLVSSIPGPAIPVSVSILLGAIVARFMVKRAVAKRSVGN